MNNHSCHTNREWNFFHREKWDVTQFRSFSLNLLHLIWIWKYVFYLLHTYSFTVGHRVWKRWLPACLKMCSIIPICVIHLAFYDRGEILPASKCFHQNIFAIRHHAIVKKELIPPKLCYHSCYCNYWKAAGYLNPTEFDQLLHFNQWY